MRRRSLLTAAWPWLAAGCASPGSAGESIVEVASGRRLSRAELLEVLRGSDYTLLGELHDNPLHHRRRGELLAALAAAAAPGRCCCIVAEHLPRGRRLAGAGPVRARLEAAGFDARGWGWPLHEPLFTAAVQAGFVVEGGNLAREVARDIARSGEPAVPAELRPLLAPLTDAARAALDADLVRGHCGAPLGSRLEGMRAAQRARDAAMWLALQDLRRRERTRTAVLLAGNGHVRRDYGVPQIAAAAEPAARLVAVGFVEPGTDAAPFDLLWTTAAATRDDPCAGFTLPPREPGRSSS